MSKTNVGVEDHEPALGEIAGDQGLGLFTRAVSRLLAGLSDRCSYRNGRRFGLRS